MMMKEYNMRACRTLITNKTVNLFTVHTNNSMFCQFGSIVFYLRMDIPQASRSFLSNITGLGVDEEGS